MNANTDTQAHGGGVEAVRRIADLLDENAECYSENAMDRAFLGNSEELAALIVEYLALAASPASPAAAMVDDMAMLIRMLVRHMETGLKIRAAAVDYLKRHNLMGSPLRDAPAPDAKGER